MSADLLQLLLETALAASAATALVLGLRLPVRRGLGARAAYALWLLVPAASCAVLLPSARVEAPVAMAAARVAANVEQPMQAAQAAPFDVTPWLALAWMLGAIAFAIRLTVRQHRFRRALGRLSARPDGSWRAESAVAGPAVIGALRGRVVLPADFEERYTPLQRELVLRHERVHMARFDLAANLLASALRCLHWFNPLLHYAIGRFRFDQELAADALVLAQRPDARRDYADAMLATSLLFDPPPLGCHWQPAHPLKERIMMLKHPLPGALRSASGALLVLGLSLSAGYAAWAAQPARAAETRFDESMPALRVTLSIGGTPVLVHESAVEAGAEDSVAQSSDGLAFEYKVTALSGDLIEVAGVVRREGKIVSSPSVRFRRGNHASLAVSSDDGDPAKDASFDLFYGTAAELRAEPRPRLQRDEDLIGATYSRLSPPRYPAEALASRVEGTVILRVLVGLDGSPSQVEIDRSSGDLRLDEAARAKVSDWRFNPASKAGEPVEGWVQVPVTFSLDGPPAPGNATGAGPDALDEIYIAAPKS